MNSNYKFLGIVVLIILAMFAYEKYEGQQREDAFFNNFKATGDNQQKFGEGFKKLNEVGSESYPLKNTDASQYDDPNAIINYPFGVSIPIVAGLKWIPMASKNMYGFVDAQTGSRNDLLMVAPGTEDLNTIINNLNKAGTPFTKVENGIFVSTNENGMTMNMFYTPSPNGGGLGIIRWMIGTPTISQSAIDALFNGIRFRQATASLAEREQLMAIDLQNQRAANQRNEVTGGDVAMERIKGIMSRCYACDGF